MGMMKKLMMDIESSIEDTYFGVGIQNPKKIQKYIKENHGLVVDLDFIKGYLEDIQDHYRYQQE